MSELRELFIDELADVLYAENLLVKTLPKMAKAAKSSELKKAFESHLKETVGHVERLKKVFAAFDEPAKPKKCDAMTGIVEEGKSILEEWKGSPALDAALISAGQKAEHYEIASYGCLCTWAKLLGNTAALQLLKETIGEEKSADEKLTEIAESLSNLEAEESEGEPETKAKNSGKASSKKGR